MRQALGFACGLTPAYELQAHPQRSCELTKGERFTRAPNHQRGSNLRIASCTGADTAKPGP
jgi:hypothetical protein